MTRPPRVLFLTYFFPPYNTIASVRTGAIAKHLSRLGWDVTVIAPHYAMFRNCDDPNECVAQMQQAGVRVLHTGHRWRFLSTIHLRRADDGVRGFLGKVARRAAWSLELDEHAGWYPEARRACRSLAPNDLDVILATGGPWGTFSVARWIARRLDCPYVLDYRDLWTIASHHRRRPKPRAERTERTLLADCAAALVVSPSMAEALEESFSVGHKTHVIWNGYDPDVLHPTEPAHFNHRAIVYAGIFYPPGSVITPVMAALGRIEAGAGPVNGLPPWRFHYYGPQGDHVRDEAARFGVLHRVVLHGVVPRPEVLSALRGACAGVVITWVAEQCDASIRGIVTGKVFEAIGLGTPIIAIAPSASDLETVITRAGRGRVFRGSDTPGLAAYLCDLILGNAPPPKAPEDFAWPNLVQRLDAVLRGAMGRAQTRCRDEGKSVHPPRSIALAPTTSH